MHSQWKRRANSQWRHPREGLGNERLSPGALDLASVHMDLLGLLEVKILPLKNVWYLEDYVYGWVHMPWSGINVLIM